MTIPEPIMVSSTAFSVIWEDIWEALKQGVLSRHHPFHTGVLATQNNGEPELRTLVLRSVVQPPYMLICHCHRRSPKIQQIVKNSKVQWLFYHPTKHIQLRLRAHACAHTSGYWFEKQWEVTNTMGRRCYLGNGIPGEISEEPNHSLPPHLMDRSPTMEESELGKEHFSVIVSTITDVDWLCLSSRGHMRAQFHIHKENRSHKITSTWVKP